MIFIKDNKLTIEKSKKSSFSYAPPPGTAKQTVLYDRHLQLTRKSRMAEFGGFLLPLWYSSLSSEHHAVRRAAGIFDCTHMGVLEVSGQAALDFLDKVTTNDVKKLKPGRAVYSYLLDAAGLVIDDIIIYHRDQQQYMLVVNAANTGKVKVWLHSILKDKALIDRENTGKKISAKPGINDLSNAAQGNLGKVDIAIQGPASEQILLKLIEDKDACSQIRSLKPFAFIETKFKEAPIMIARTGYTGSRIGFELFICPDQARILWDALLEHGQPLGLQCCGLGARDSLRVEAGLPLYSHELAGPFDILPTEAGYGWAVKSEKEFFIGKKPLLENTKKSDYAVCRIQLPGGKGLRPVRPGDPVIDSENKCEGYITSAAVIDNRQIAMAYIHKSLTEPGNKTGVYYLARNNKHLSEGRKDVVELKENIPPDIEGEVINRFEKF